MSIGQWLALQQKYDIRILDVHYKKMTVEEGEKFIKMILESIEKDNENDLPEVN